METSASHHHFVFGSFNYPIKLVFNPSIKPKFDGFSIMIGEISCVINNPCCNIVNEDDTVFVDSHEDEKSEVTWIEESVLCFQCFWSIERVHQSITEVFCHVVLRWRDFLMALPPWGILPCGPSLENRPNNLLSSSTISSAFSSYKTIQLSISIPTEELGRFCYSLFSTFSNKLNPVSGGYLGIEEKNDWFFSIHTLIRHSRSSQDGRCIVLKFQFTGSTYCT